MVNGRNNESGSGLKLNGTITYPPEKKKGTRIQPDKIAAINSDLDTYRIFF